MLRRMAAWSINFANFGKCSLIWMPGTLVLIGLKVPALAVPGFMSNVSLWLGPPAIHSRMHALGLVVWAAAPWAMTLNQPDRDRLDTPAAASFRASRRDRPGFSLPLNMG